MGVNRHNNHNGHSNRVREGHTSIHHQHRYEDCWPKLYLNLPTHCFVATAQTKSSHFSCPRLLFVVRWPSSKLLHRLPSSTQLGNWVAMNNCHVIRFNAYQLFSHNVQFVVVPLHLHIPSIHPHIFSAFKQLPLPSPSAYVYPILILSSISTPPSSVHGPRRRTGL